MAAENNQAKQVLQVCFLIDCTGFLDDHVIASKSFMAGLQSKISTSRPAFLNDMEVAFVRYTDYDNPEETRTTALDFTRSVDDYKAFTAPIVSEGGGDAPEDVFGGLRKAISLKWKQESIKVLVHITDAPCHGKQYHDDLDDQFPDGDPAGSTLADVLDPLFAMKHFCYLFGTLNDYYTKHMISEFRKHLQQLPGKPTINQFDAELHRMIVDKIDVAINRFIDQCPAQPEAEQKPPEQKPPDQKPPDQKPPDQKKPSEQKPPEQKPPAEKPLELDPVQYPIDWTTIASGRYALLTMEQPAVIAEVTKVGFEGEITKAKRAVEVKRALNPFAAGEHRLILDALFNGEEGWVVKQFHQALEDDQAQAFYQEELKRKAIAAKLASDFVAQCDPALKIAVAEPCVIRKSGLQGTEFLGLERRAPDTPTSQPAAELLQTFAHWSWCYSGGQLMIAASRAVQAGDATILIARPVIHSRTQSHFGQSDLGSEGFQAFFEAHKCSSLCTSLGIHESNTSSGHIATPKQLTVESPSDGEQPPEKPPRKPVRSRSRHANKPPAGSRSPPQSRASSSTDVPPPKPERIPRKPAANPRVSANDDSDSDSASD